MSLGAILYLVDLGNSARNFHLFLVPALILLATGALFTVAGTLTRRAPTP